MLQAWSEKHNSFFRPLKKKGFKEERVTTIGLYNIGKPHDPGIQQEPRGFTCCIPKAQRSTAGVWAGRNIRNTLSVVISVVPMACAHRPVRILEASDGAGADCGRTSAPVNGARGGWRQALTGTRHHAITPTEGTIMVSSVRALAIEEATIADIHTAYRAGTL